MTQATSRAVRRRARLHAIAACAGCVALTVFALSSGSCEAINRAANPRPVAPTTSDARAIVRAPQGSIRVRMGEATDRAEFSADGPIDLTLGSSRTPARTVTGPLTVSLTDGGWRIQSSTLSEQLRPGPLTISARSGQITFGAGAHEGVFHLHPRPDLSPGVFDIVEHVPLEIYIAGVISKELYPGWSHTAYEAQAIAARSYALHEQSRRVREGRTYDVESSTRDQVYAGATASPVALRAAENTAGKVLTYRGQTLRAYYSSTCGGRPASARHTWPTGPGFEFNLVAPIQTHLRDHACQSSPLYTWEVRRPTSEVVQRIAAFGKQQGFAIRDIASLSKITPVRTNEVDRPTRYRITDAGGKWWNLSAEDLRIAMNQSGGTALQAPTRETRVNSSDIEVEVRGDTTIVRGRGFGHGVGMCQFGAEGFAKKGETAEQILARFYPGATIERPSPPVLFR